MESFSSEMQTDCMQNGSEEVIGNNNNNYTKPTRYTEVCHNLLITKETFNRLFMIFQKLPVDITAHNKKTLIENLISLEIEFEKYSNIIKQNIDQNLKFTLNYLNNATQMCQRVKQQMWKTQIDCWFSEMRKKRKSLSTDLDNNMEMSKSTPLENLSRKKIKLSIQSEEYLSGDVVTSTGISEAPSEFEFDGNASFCSNISESRLISPFKEYSPTKERDNVPVEKEKSKVWQNATGRSMPSLFDNITLGEHQSESQGGENYLAPINGEKTPPLESVCTPVTCQKGHEVLDYVKPPKIRIIAKPWKQRSFIANDELSLENHVKKSHTKAEKKNNLSVNKDSKEVYQCCTCLKSFRSQELLIIHESEHKTLFYRCDFCNKLNKSRYELNKHISQHLTDDSRKFLCKVCYRYFDTNEKCIKHLKQQHHLKANKYPDKMLCVICALEYDDPNELMLHIKQEHDSTVKRKGNQKNIRSPKCRFCDIYFTNLRLLEVHIISVHGVQPYECAVCKITLLTKAHFDIHILQHTKEEELRSGLIPKKRGTHQTQIRVNS